MKKQEVVVVDDYLWNELKELNVRASFSKGLNILSKLKREFKENGQYCDNKHYN